MNNLPKISAIQKSVMKDVCNIKHVTLSSGTYSTKTTKSYTIVSGVACGIKFTGGRLVQSGQTILVDYDAVLRLPASLPIYMTDEIELVEKGDTIISGTFMPYAQPVVNSTVQHVQLKRQA